MTNYDIEIILQISFYNTEKERLDEKKINELIEYLEFNNLEILDEKLIDTEYNNVNGKLKEVRVYKLIISSSFVEIDMDAGKEVMSVINNYESGKYTIKAINLNFLDTKTEVK